MRALLVVVLLAASVAYAEPTPYTIDTKTGLTRVAERNLYDAVRGMVAPVARWLGLTATEEECANAVAAQSLIKATKEAMGAGMFGLTGADEALKMFEKSQDDWCNKAGGMRGAVEIAPRAARAQSFMRPFLQEKLKEATAGQDEPLTPAQVAAIIAAGLLALPVLAVP